MTFNTRLPQRQELAAAAAPRPSVASQGFGTVAAMAFVQSDGVDLYVEETGGGYPIVFVHEFGSDHREWEPQVRWFSRAYRCITYNARGYPPSDVPEDPEQYGWEHAVADLLAVLDVVDDVCITAPNGLPAERTSEYDAAIAAYLLPGGVDQ